MGPRISVAAVVLASMVIASAAAVACLAYADQNGGGMFEKWSVEAEDDSTSSQFDLLYLTDDGLVGTGYQHSWFDGVHGNFIFGMDLNGSFVWHFGTNAQPTPSAGSDGGHYYVDWLEGATGHSDDTRSQWRNLTALGRDGAFKWNYIAPNGSVALWAVRSDGTVIAAHVNGPYSWLYPPGEVVAISSDGAVRWNATFPLSDRRATGPGFLDNGTFAVIVHDTNVSYEVGFDPEDGSSYVKEVERAHLDPYSPLSANATTVFEMRKEAVDENITVVSAYAIDLSDGTTVWRRVLYHDDNPEHDLPGSGYMVKGTLVDPTGVVLCSDFEDKNTYALSTDGELLWERPSWYGGIATYPSGGFLVTDGTFLKKIMPDGSTAWQYDAEKFSGGWGRILLADDGNIYYSTGSAVAAVARSDAMSSNAVLVGIIVLLNAAVLAGYGLVGRRRIK